MLVNVHVTVSPGSSSIVATSPAVLLAVPLPSLSTQLAVVSKSASAASVTVKVPGTTLVNVSVLENIPSASSSSVNALGAAISSVNAKSCP